VRLARADDAAAIATIYNEGIADRIATFETGRARRADRPPARRQGDRYPTVVVDRVGRSWHGRAPGHIATGRRMPGRRALGVCGTSCAWHRCGRAALEGLIRAYAQRGFWKIVSRIFPENTTSIRLHERCGFRVVGVYRRHGKLEDEWRDCVIVERLLEDDRSTER
jgi:phosphinothricin acetyltransferase